VLDNIVLELIEKETVTQADMARLCAPVRKREPFAPFNGFGKRRPSDRPPVLTPAERGALKASAEADGARAQANGSASTDTLTQPTAETPYGSPDSGQYGGGPGSGPYGGSGSGPADAGVRDPWDGPR
jgi:cell division protease FtsH